MWDLLWSLFLYSTFLIVSLLLFLYLSPYQSWKRKAAPDLEKWLSKKEEKPIDTHIEIVDPHHHLWDLEQRFPNTLFFGYLFLFFKAFRFQLRYELPELEQDLLQNNVIGTVFIECEQSFDSSLFPEHLRPVGETKYVNRVAQEAQNKRCTGIISFVDLTIGKVKVAEALREHMKQSLNFRGIRHACHWLDGKATYRSNAPEGCLLSEDFREGFSVLVNHDLVFDCYISYQQLKELADLARSFPTAVIVLDHVGSPFGISSTSTTTSSADSREKREKIEKMWKEGIQEVAQSSPNVYCKLGGLTMIWAGFEFEKQEIPPSSDQLVEKTGPYYQYCIDQFGTDRCMW
eukprot:CAMPEP_0201492456 /NCGR_PEP_ID=MMETSP0151_2-20130828/33173_1 /ASSEMBLY_ACC=CAM_ASM_000257 /TAXON_ID=200890 /ORGANISM="Paramoeba atlantica, Strain 621/1 / CCAP 1560/9" /LENGTH=345 /DNA_ID=CAMNT_0047879271 /DNA_START=288 /DNA_END=1322 /DNA_ORIENTATION=+